MKRFFLILITIFPFCAWALAQDAAAPVWTGFAGEGPSEIQTRLVASSERSIVVDIHVPGFFATDVQTEQGKAQVISLPKSTNSYTAGEPDLPFTVIPAIIGDHALTDIRVTKATYHDFQDIDVAPSKGNLSRQVDPATVPYPYGECYRTDAFFPKSQVQLEKPYILRDYRGQNLVVYPFAYNPVTRTLRVYDNMTVELYVIGNGGENQKTRKSGVFSTDPEFAEVYSNRFINYAEAKSRYVPINENGELLIICHKKFLSAMEPFVEWKQTIGRPTTLVSTDETGTTANAIKNYINAYYDIHPNLTHVLLVGDCDKIPGIYTNPSGYEGYSDQRYGQVVGDDYYNDLIIGRFSANSISEVTTQVNRTITYERDLTPSATWLKNGMGVGARSNGGGHYNEDDYQHLDNIRADLLGYTYATVYREYKNVSGVNSTTTTISNNINNGVGIINYCNHGSETAWQSHNYSNSHVNALTNDNMLPFIISVACKNGKYDYTGGDCFAEAWMHATHGTNGVPTGAIGGIFSYISQPWIPPMWGQDEMNDILVESYSDNIKRTLGGVLTNGNMSVLDHYNDNYGIGTYCMWNIFGDPTLTLRTDVPSEMTVSHPGSLDINATDYAVQVSGGEGALATLSMNGAILGSATVSNGVANIYFEALGEPMELTLCVFGYNKVTYLGTIQAMETEAHWTIDPGLYAENMTVLAVIQIDGEEQQSEALEVGAFCGEECRGVGNPMYCPPIDRYLLPLMVYGEEGDSIHFKLYDPDGHLEMDAEDDCNLIFQADGYGTADDPVILSFNASNPPATFTQHYNLTPGWNWWSVPVEIGADGFETLIALLGSSATHIKGISTFADYSEEAGWHGTLSTIDNEGMYMINCSEDISFDWEGVPAKASEHPLAITPGWNWICFIATEPMSLEEALAGLNPTEGDLIKSGSSFSTYNGTQWIGTLSMLQPGTGYILLSNGEAKIFYFPESTKNKP